MGQKSKPNNLSLVGSMVSKKDAIFNNPPNPKAPMVNYDENLVSEDK
jgi:hypothetical protein